MSLMDEYSPAVKEKIVFEYPVIRTLTALFGILGLSPGRCKEQKQSLLQNKQFSQRRELPIEVVMEQTKPSIIVKFQ